MLLALFAIMVMIIGATLIAQAHVSRAISQHQAEQLEQVMQYVKEMDGVLLEWLEQDASDIVLGLDTDTPCVLIAEERLLSRAGRVLISVHAWDQQGMWPHTSQRLGLSVSGAVTKGEDSVLVDAHYPKHHGDLRQAGLVSTHNPWPVRSGSTRAGVVSQINLNTAPLELLNQIDEQYGIVNLNETIEHRSTGTASVPQGLLRQGRQPGIRLVGSSQIWSFRIDVEMASVIRSCWATYTNRGGKWQMIHRVLIDE